MERYQTKGRMLFNLFNYVFLALTSLLCILPVIHVLAMSLSSNTQVEAGNVTFFPVDFTTRAYSFIVNDTRFVTAFGVTFRRVILGLSFNMFLTVLVAYPISKERRSFLARPYYVWFFMLTILFSGGLIPTYMVVKQTGLLDTIWALVLPSAVPVFNIILLQNFFKALPKELEESAFIDGAGHLTILFRIFIPLSKPALATLTLFAAVGHWNAWFDGMIYMNRPQNLPLQSYLHSIVVKRDLSEVTHVDMSLMLSLGEKNNKAAQIFVAMVPILMVYPFLQKYFTKGIMLGSVKG